MSPLEGIELVIDPIRARKGEVISGPRGGTGPGAWRSAFIFHDLADREVWLDGLREQGLRDEEAKP